MPNRIIKESIRTSRNVNALSDFEFRIWAYLITYVDDYGRGSADAELLKGIVFPRRKGITEAQIEKALASLASNGMVNLYYADGEPYFYFPNWDKHQQVRAKKSKFPEPDSTCNQMISSDSKCPRNPIQSESESESNPNASNARTRFAPPTLDEVKAYCEERKNGIDAQHFIDYYESNGWKVGRNGMKDWKATVRNWEQRNKPKKESEWSFDDF